MKFEAGSRRKTESANLKVTPAILGLNFSSNVAHVKVAMADLGSSLELWELISEAGFIIVIVGVLGEGAELAVKWFTWKRCHKRLGRHLRGLLFPTVRFLRRRLLPTETLFFLVLVVGLAIEFIGSHKAMRIAGRENSRLNEEAAKARKDAGEAIERASKSDLARVELEKQLAPRRLAGNQRSFLVKLLSDDPGGVVIVSSLMDGESSDFADDFAAAFQEAHWQTLRVRNFAWNWNGLFIGTLAGTKILDVKRVSAALTAIEVHHQEKVVAEEDRQRMSPWFEPGVLYLIVAHKPPPVTFGNKSPN